MWNSTRELLHEGLVSPHGETDPLTLMAFPTSLPLRLVSHALRIGAIHLSCVRGLRRREAVSRLTPPETLPPLEPPEPAPTKSTPWYRDRQRVVGLVVMMCGVVVPLQPALAAWGKPIPTPRLLVDIFWVHLLVTMLWAQFKDASLDVIPPYRQLSLRAPKSARGESWILHAEDTPEGKLSWRNNQRLRSITSLVVVIGIVLLCYLGERDAAMIASVAMVLWALPSISSSSISMRVVVYLVYGATAMFALIPAIVAFLPSKEKKPPLDGKSLGLPSPWMLPLMSLWMNNMFYIILGAFMMLNMRYDAQRSSPPALPAAPGDPVEMGRHLSFPPSPLHYWTLAILTTALGSLEAYRYTHPSAEPFEGLLYTFYVIAAALLVGTVGITWCRGDLKGWWTYYEDWQPEIDAGLLQERRAPQTPPKESWESEKRVENENEALPA